MDGAGMIARRLALGGTIMPPLVRTAPRRTSLAGRALRLAAAILVAVLLCALLARIPA